MLQAVLMKQKERSYQAIIAISFIVFIIVYTLLDNFNGGYGAMRREYGALLPVINVIINIFMSALSAFMMSISTAFFKLSGKEGKGSFFSGASVLFGILTYGCTSCVIAFFATIGITFSVAVLPFAGLPYKLISLVLILIGFWWLIHEIKNPKCKIK